MIKKIQFGLPVHTGAVVKKDCKSCKSVDFGKVVSEWPFKWQYQLDESQIVYGLGENMRGMNKRGYKYVSWCSDNPNQNEYSESLYGAHNFILVFGTETFGVFFDTASRISFDAGYTRTDMLTVETEDTGVEVYFIQSDSGKNMLDDITTQFRNLIGKSYIPPFWAFGYQQSRWGYQNAEDVRNVVEKHRELNMPLDSVVMDIDYMQDFMDFTVNQERFPNLADFAKKMKDQDINLIPIIDAGVKVKEGYSVYDEGIKKGYFCKKDDGKEFVGGVWPGRSVFPDFLNPEVRAWFGEKYRFLTDQGIEGFWNDMNEPALFYSDESLSQMFEKISSMSGKNIDLWGFFGLKDTALGTANSMEDYKRFYHILPQDTVTGDATANSAGADTPTPVKIRHDKVHNIYGANMTRSAGEGLAKINPDKRFLLYSRASCIGAHRYGGIWTGDNMSTWAHLEQEIKMMPGLNMCGFLYTGADAGGFGANTTKDLVMRWLAFADFTPLMRNHCALGCRPQEVYSFDKPEDFKSILDLRYALIPYIYSEFVKAAQNGKMFMKPLSYLYENDRRACTTEDQLFVGENIMVAPVYKQNAEGRYVYLPEEMTMVEWRNSQAKTRTIKKGDHWINIPLDTVVFFVRKGTLVPLAKPALSTKKINYDQWTFVGTGKKYSLYKDDGYTTKINLEKGTEILNK